MYSRNSMNCSMNSDQSGGGLSHNGTASHMIPALRALSNGRRQLSDFPSPADRPDENNNNPPERFAGDCVTVVQPRSPHW